MLSLEPPDSATPDPLAANVFRNDEALAQHPLVTYTGFTGRSELGYRF